MTKAIALAAMVLAILATIALGVSEPWNSHELDQLEEDLTDGSGGPARFGEGESLPLGSVTINGTFQVLTNSPNGSLLPGERFSIRDEYSTILVTGALPAPGAWMSAIYAIDQEGEGTLGLLWSSRLTLVATDNGTKPVAEILVFRNNSLRFWDRSPDCTPMVTKDNRTQQSETTFVTPGEVASVSYAGDNSCPVGMLKLSYHGNALLRVDPG